MPLSPLPAMSRKRRKLALIFVAVVATGVVFWKLATPVDLRPASVRGPLPSSAQSAGRRMLDRLVASYGGLTQYAELRATQVDLSDTWASSFVRRVGSPWLEGERLRLTYLHTSDNARLDFLAGPRVGLSWGIQQWQTYEVRSGQRQFRPSRDVKFWLPTLVYFLELPFRIGEATVVQYAGEQVLGSQIYDLVYVTWGTAEPQRQVDQYVLWIRRADTTLEFAEYTVRDVAPFMVGCIHYEDLRPVEGIRIPHRMSLGDCPGRPGLLHRLTVDSLHFLPTLPRDQLVPEPLRQQSKDG